VPILAPLRKLCRVWPLLIRWLIPLITRRGEAFGLISANYYDRDRDRDRDRDHDHDHDHDPDRDHDHDPDHDHDRDPASSARAIAAIISAPSATRASIL